MLQLNCIDRHLKKIQAKLQLFGLVMILQIQKKYLTKNYIKMFVKQQMV